MHRTLSARPTAMRALQPAALSHCTLLFPLRSHSEPAVHKPTLTPEQQRLMDSQSHRKIHKAVPGKLFMLNYLSHEQSATSITNRILSVGVILGGACWFSIYGPNITSYSVLTAMLLVLFPAFFMYVHMGYWQLFPAIACGAVYAMRR